MYETGAIFHRISVALAILSLAIAAGSATGQDDLEARLDAEEAADTGTALTVIFDTSGSMAKRNKIDQAKRAFTWWLEGLPDDYRFCLIQCDNKGKIVLPLGATKKEVGERVLKFRPGSGTPIVNSLLLAAREIGNRRQDHSPYERHVVVLFTDGRESVHKGGVPRVREEVLNLRGLKVEVVGIGFHGEGDYLREVSTSYFQANDEEQLKQGLSKVDAEVDLAAEIDVSPSDILTMEELAAHSVDDFDPTIPVTAEEREATDQKYGNVSVNGPPGPEVSGRGLFLFSLVCIAFIVLVLAGAVGLFLKFLSTGRR
jgi:hypothetical protein